MRVSLCCTQTLAFKTLPSLVLLLPLNTKVKILSPGQSNNIYITLVVKRMCLFCLEESRRGAVNVFYYQHIILKVVSGSTAPLA